MICSTASTRDSSLRELTTVDRLYPFWGSIKGFRRGFRGFFLTLAISPVAIYASILSVVAAGIGVTLLLTSHPVGPIWAVATLAAVAAIGERSTVSLSRSVEVSVSVGLFPTLFAAVAFGPLAALVVSAASMICDFRRPFLKWAVYTASRSINGAVAGVVAASVIGGHHGEFTAIALATVAAGLTAETLDVIFVSLTLKIRRTGSFRDGVRTLGPVIASALPLQTPVVACLAYAFVSGSAWTLPLFLGPAIAAQRLFVLYREQRQLAHDLLNANERLESANLSFATALVATLDARDRYTAGHSAAVAMYARDIAARLGLPEAEQQLAHLCGLVHDIGKVGLPPGLLEKPGPLSLQERHQMEQHPAIGERILANVDDYATIAKIVRHHHERVDGHGYPDRLVGDEIPLISRILAVADAYDAMTSDRPYRDAMPTQVARLRLAQAVESQFDTSVVAAFEAILAGSSDGYRFHASSDREPSLSRVTAAAV
jgi:putative nucleotidyltransferase with HDIG domain